MTSKLKGKTDPQTTIYDVVYGVKGSVNDVPVNLWDRFYFYDNTSLKYEVPIDLNGKKITGVADGTDDTDVVNKRQLNNLQEKLNYFYYTNDLKHDNKNFVNLPSNIDKYPFK